MSKTESPLLRKLLGRWRGTVRTWLEPDATPLTGDVVASFRTVLDGPTVLHEYQSSVGEHRSDGMALLGSDLATGKPCLAWLDTFHTSASLMLFASDGEATTDEVSFLGKYAAGAELWGWRITYRLPDDGDLTIRHWNIPPGGEEVLAVEVVCAREAGS